MPIALPTFVGGMPGGMELAVIFMLFLFFVIPIGLVIVGVTVLRGRGGSDPADEQRTEPVDERLDRVEAQLDEIQDSLESVQNQEARQNKESDSAAQE